MKRVLIAFVSVIVIAAVGAGAFLGGVIYAQAASGGMPLPTLPAKRSEPGALLDQVRGIIRDTALAPSSDESITANALEGALRSLDDSYAAYFDPKDYQEFQNDSRGEFFGIGITISVNADGQPQVVMPIEGTPAARAGLKAGDVISAIDGKSKAKWDSDEVVGLIRGPIGTKVTLTIKRGTKDPFKVTITRDRIVVPNVVKRMYPKGVGYVRLMGFNERSADELRAVLAELDKQGAKGFILDLRGNPGGLLRSAVDVASLFVKDGVIVRVDERGKPEEEERATGNTATDKPLVLLVDMHSASASEIVAGALQDYARATLVGVTTYGKGSVQSIRSLDNGGAIKLTIAHYLTPKKRVINQKGVTPENIVVMDPQLQGDDAKDTQLKRAIEVLRAKF